MGAGQSRIATGAASGLGLADAQLLTERGAQVVMTDVDQDRGAELAGQLGAILCSKMLLMKVVGKR